MDNKYVLHITDLHIEDPVRGRELLRQGKYKEYLGDLTEKIMASGVPRIDAIVATGDFINQGKKEHLPHANAVIDFLLERFKLEKSNLAGCLGNHDLQQALEREGKAVESRAPVVDFLKSFANGNPKSVVDSVKDRAVLCQPHSAIWCLMIDSILGCEAAKSPNPGLLDRPAETDGIAELVRAVPQDDILIVGTHYAVEPNVGRLAAFEDDQPDWFERHFWKDATPIRERIWRIRKDARQTVWLCGDIHREDRIVRDGILHVTTGRLGTQSGSGDSPILRQATVIEFSEAEMRLLKATYASDPNAEYGDWNTQWIETEKDAMTELEAARPTAVNVKTPDARRLTITTHPEENVSLISTTGEEDILRALRDKDLYSWGRFATSGDEVLLSWISVGPLLNVPELLGATVSDMSNWVEHRLSELSVSFEDVLLIGVDCWGGVLASQISIITGAPNYCVAARGRGEYHTSHEGISVEVCEGVKNAKAVVLVSDVIATGHTQKWVRDKIGDGLCEERTDLIWLSLSVLTDPTQPLAADCSFITAHGTACRIKRPFLSADRVPPDDLVPTQISFI